MSNRHHLEDDCSKDDDDIKGNEAEDGNVKGAACHGMLESLPFGWGCRRWAMLCSMLLQVEMPVGPVFEGHVALWMSLSSATWFPSKVLLLVTGKHIERWRRCYYMMGIASMGCPWMFIEEWVCEGLQMCRGGAST